MHIVFPLKSNPGACLILKFYAAAFIEEHHVKVGDGYFKVSGIAPIKFQNFVIFSFHIKIYNFKIYSLHYSELHFNFIFP